jgi:hypothetical protein
MLANKDIFKEVELAEKVRESSKDEIAKAQLKMQILTVKLLHNIRTNMVSVMRHNNIPLVEPEDKTVQTN